MAINLEMDVLVPVSELVRQKLGKRISPATLWRWRLKGINGARLECVLCGGRWLSTSSSFAEFLRVQTANVQPALIDAPAPTERSAATTKKLAAAGLL